jgi:ABC-2 type transport system permease protein
MRGTVLQLFKKSRSLAVYFGLPLAGIFISFLFGSSSEMTLHLGVVNHDGNQAITRDAIQYLNGMRDIRVTLLEEAVAKDRLVSGKLDSFIVFDTGFAQSLKAGKPDHVELVSIKGAQMTVFVKSLLYSYNNNVAAIGNAAGGDSARFDQMYAAYRGAEFKLTADRIDNRAVHTRMTQMTFGFLITFMLFSAVNLSGMIIKERENRTLQRLFAAPITARAYVTANISVNLMIMLAQIAVTLLLMQTLFHIDPGIPGWQLFLVLSLFALVAVAMSLVIVAFAKSTAVATALQNVIIMPTSILAGCFFSVQIMPEAIQRVSEFMPQYWLMELVSQHHKGEAVESMYAPILILLAFATTFFLTAVFQFSRNQDMKTFV